VTGERHRAVERQLADEPRQAILVAAREAQGVAAHDQRVDIGSPRAQRRDGAQQLMLPSPGLQPSHTADKRLAGRQ
jgi:hypothetical protein